MADYSLKSPYDDVESLAQQMDKMVIAAQSFGFDAIVIRQAARELRLLTQELYVLRARDHNK